MNTLKKSEISFCFFIIFFFFNATATTEIYTLSLHDALPISGPPAGSGWCTWPAFRWPCCASSDRKSTRLNFSHVEISYAVFCLKKQKITLTSFFLKKTKNHKQSHNEELLNR